MIRRYLGPEKNMNGVEKEVLVHIEFGKHEDDIDHPVDVKHDVVLAQVIITMVVKCSVEEVVLRFTPKTLKEVVLIRSSCALRISV